MSDVLTQFTKDLFGVDEVTSQQRTVAKALKFFTLYGPGPGHTFINSYARCPACGYYAFDGTQCWDCGYHI